MTAELSERQRKLIRTWARGKRAVKCREEAELVGLGLVARYGGPGPGGLVGYMSFPCLSLAGLAEVRRVEFFREVVGADGRLMNPDEIAAYVKGLSPEPQQ